MDGITREMLYVSAEGTPGTFEKDELAIPLPLPQLNDTLDRYYESLLPFGTADQLQNSRQIIDEFRNGIGIRLQRILEERTRTHKNWVERWWEDYAYCTDRTPIFPFATMTSTVPCDAIGLETTPEKALMNVSRVAHHCLEYWDLLRRERIRPNTNPNGSITYSSFMLRRVFSTSRLPGETMDRIESHFKTIAEGETPSYYLIIGRGRIFRINGLNEDGTILTMQQLLTIHRQIRATIDEKPVELPVPVLTCANRSAWAANRKYLAELSRHNADTLDVIAKAICVMSLDENSPRTYSDTSAMNIGGDLHSKWVDNSCGMVAYRNGQWSCVGEHSCFDGSICVTFEFWLMISLLQVPEPDWYQLPAQAPVPIELKFDLDDHMVKEIQDTWTFVEKTKNSIIVSTTQFDGYGKDFMKLHRLQPDAYIQMILQLTHYKMHGELVATYETALMRNYYNGRTETVRSCSMDAVRWVRTFINHLESDENRLKSLKIAVETQNNLMEAARNGKGVDRHLFGLWCAAYEADLPVPELFEDELYKKSGGGGNYVLSTSSLGYTIVNGFVGPMCLDGYATFYSITNEIIHLNVTAFRESQKTSAHKFGECFDQSMREVRDMVERVALPKL